MMWVEKGRLRLVRLLHVAATPKDNGWISLNPSEGAWSPIHRNEAITALMGFPA